MDRPEASPEPAPGPLRLALMTGVYNFISDGISLTLNRLVADLERDGVDVLVLAPTAKEAAFQHTGTLVSVPSVPIPFRSDYRLSLGFGRVARRRLEAFQPQLFHLAAPDILGQRSLRLARRWKIPVLASYHTRYETYFSYYGAGLLKPIADTYLKRFYRACDCVCAPSSSMAEELTREGYGDDIRVWGRGVDAARFNPGQRSLPWRRKHGIADDEVVVAFVSRLVREKDLGTLAATCQTLRARGVSFRTLVVGDGPDRAELEKQMGDHAIFTGFLDGSGLAHAFASSDIFMFPSLTETFGNVTLEAMASGLPTVCAEASGSRSLVDHGVSGYLVTPRAIDAFADTLERLIGDPMLRQSMGEAALERSRAFTREAAYGQLRAVYDDLLGRQPAITGDAGP